MSRAFPKSAGRSFFLSISAMLLLVTACGEITTSSNTVPNGNTTVAKGADLALLPKRGKSKLPNPPAKAVFGMIYNNTESGREYIFDGAVWVPHDSTVESFYSALPHAKSTAMTASEICTDGDPSCTPTGAHGGAATEPAGHFSFDCRVCHKVGGRLSFANGGPAFAVGRPAPSFDVTDKTCANIACHAISPGFFSYYFPGGDGEPELITVSYGGPATAVTPSWYSAGSSNCAACHGNPPTTGSNGSNVWHSGYHGGGGPASPLNQCQFCHPDASSPGNGIGDRITNASLHANGAVNVQVTFKTSCFGCH